MEDKIEVVVVDSEAELVAEVTSAVEEAVVALYADLYGFEDYGYEDF